MNRIPVSTLSILLALGVAACGRSAPSADGALPQGSAGSAPARDAMSAQGNTAAPAAPQASGDQAVTSKVRTALESIPGVKSEQISVSVSDGVVTLGGPVQTAQEHKQILARIASLDGVKSVVDDLRPVSGS